jgi:hypothetical protein
MGSSPIAHIGNFVPFNFLRNKYMIKNNNNNKNLLLLPHNTIANITENIETTTINDIENNYNNGDNLIILDKDNIEEYSFIINSSDILLTLTNSYYKENIVNLIGKMIIFRETRNVDILTLANALNTINIDTLNIFSINGYGITNKVNIVKTKEPSDVKYIEIGVEEFINQINSENCDFSSFNKHSLYILRNGSYINAKNMFKSIKNTQVSLGRGGSQKAHALSPLDFRLSSYVMAMFNFDYKLINYLNTFDSMSKDKYLPLGLKFKNK